MSVIMKDHTSFIMDPKWRTSEIFSIEDKSIRRKKKNNNKYVKKKSKDIDVDKDRKITKKKPLYDSLDEEEDYQENEDSYFYINPEGKFILILDTIVLISTIICFLYTPF